MHVQTESPLARMNNTLSRKAGRMGLPQAVSQGFAPGNSQVDSETEMASILAKRGHVAQRHLATSTTCTYFFHAAGALLRCRVAALVSCGHVASVK